MVVNFLFTFFFECFSIHDFSKDGGDYISMTSGFDRRFLPSF